MNQQPKLEAYVRILNNTALLLSNPAIGLVKDEKAIALLNYATSVYQEATASATALKEVDDQIALLVAEGRVPTEEEWQTWTTRLEALDKGFADVKAGLPPKT